MLFKSSRVLFLTGFLISTGQSAIFVVTTTNDSGNGSLRQAITDANATSGANSIVFNIPGSGIRTIAPLTALPDITNAVTINGYSQPGSNPNTLAAGNNAALLIRLDGISFTAPFEPALTVRAGNSSILGLIVVRFPYGICIDGCSNNRIAGNWIGMDADGISRGMTYDGITVTDFSFGAAMFNTIGGNSPGDRNVISGNSVGISLFPLAAANNFVLGNFIGTDPGGTLPRGNIFRGIDIQGTTNIFVANNLLAASTGAGGAGIIINGGGGHIIQGNFIGTDVTGEYDLGNSSDGIFVQGATGVRIGGTGSAQGNRICNNRRHGVFFNGSSSGIIEGNLIGTDASATRPLGNLGAGINLQSGSTNRVVANVIQFNGAPGINLGSGTANEISANRIHDNGGLGIDLKGDGISTNDLTDADAGPNGLQNYPVLTSAFSSNSMTHIEGSLNSTPNTSFRLEFYASPSWDPQGIAEGQLFLRSTNVLTDGNGDVSFAVNAPAPTPAGYILTATATDPSGNTSEFSAAQTPAVAQPQSVELSIARNDPGSSNSVATISWPSTATGFSLEHTPSLSPPTQWYPVSGPINDNGSAKSYVITNNVVTNDFFRLRLPQM
jgi:parallel beta-helix repeat protein